MRKTFTNLVASCITVFGFASTANAQFEGTIEFKKITPAETVTYVYYVKGDKIRIDEIGATSKKVEGTSIIDLATKKMISINHGRKMYMDQKPGTPATINGKPETNETKKTKTLLGASCKEVVVTNKDDNTIVKYYFAGSKFNFLSNLLKFLNRKDKSAIYYPFNAASDAFPYLSVQTDLNGTEVSRFEAVKIEKKAVGADVFDIPKDYKKFEQ